MSTPWSSISLAAILRRVYGTSSWLASSNCLARYLGLSANWKLVIVAIIDGQGQDAQTMSALDQYCLSVFLLDSSS